jgi:type II secretory pathway component PulF
LTALKITEGVVQNVVLQEAIALTREGVTDGKTLAQPLAKSGVFPKLMVDLIHIGEQTGDVPASLENLAETYENELESNLRTVTTMIGPILIVFIAAVVAFMLVGVLQAMFKITSSIGAQ